VPKKILIFSASIGNGHLQAGRALESALRTISSEVEVRHENALDFANVAFRNLYQKAYAELGKFSD
jgi:UDP-N-acetylglucosamine:LPS N-acetylglucosamine transferase